MSEIEINNDTKIQGEKNKISEVQVILLHVNKKTLMSKIFN